MTRRSCIYQGRIRHRRFEPVEHAFSFPLFMMYLDLSEIETLFRGRWLWSSRRIAPARFRRSDYLGDPSSSLDGAVRDLVWSRTGVRHTGPITLLTHLRYWGYCFNPLSLYFCLDDDGRTARAIVAEVTNTPWGERHCYVLHRPLEGSTPGRQRYRSVKQLHVSPFMGMDITYDWTIRSPGRRLAVRISNRRNDRRIFDATMALERKEISTSSLSWSLARFPWMTAQVVLAIHAQALRLWLKGAPVHVHPERPAVVDARKT